MLVLYHKEAGGESNMNRSIAEKIADWSCQDAIQNTEEYAVILYGIEVILENITKVIVLVFIGIFLHRMKEAFIILLAPSSSILVIV